MRKLFLLCVMFVAFVTAYAQQVVPEVIPALKEWKSSRGKLVLPESGKIYISADEEPQLKKYADILAADLKEMFGWEYQVAVGKPSRNGISLSLCKADEKLGNEGYRMNISSGVAIEAPYDKGVFWGTRTLLQMINNQPEGLAKGKATDFPEYPNRGFMIDVGRKFFTMDYLKDYVKIMAFYKMNELQVHLNDNGFLEFADNDWNKAYSAFRLESEKFPGLTARDGSYTKEEFREFQKMAASYGVNVIPEIDVPAHSLAFTHYNPNLAADKKEYGMDHIDLYKKEVYDFVDALFDEYLSGDDPVFVGKEVHIGTDEYNKKEAEQFRHFTNHCIDLVKGYGKTPRLWGSLNQMKGNTEVDLTGTVVSAWNYGWMDWETAVKAGAKAVNMCDCFLYIVPAVNYYHDFLDCKWLYENWTPEMMKPGHKPERHPDMLGAMMAVWNDRVGNGASMQDIHVRTFPALQMLSDKLWKGENASVVPFEKFNELCLRTPEAPGVNLLARVEGLKNITAPGEETVLKGNNTVKTSVPEIGYPYVVEFEICPDKDNGADAVLFNGPHSMFLANWQSTGKFAFRRDGYEMVFHSYRLPEGEWTKVRIEGDAKGTSLYVNGELKERLEGRVKRAYNERAKRQDYIWMLETLIFPLETIGDENLGFSGKIRNVTCKNVSEK